MNAMMPIHISNSNGSYTIIFHIIQTIMLTHQLACMNISFSIHISSHSIQENSHGQFQSNKQIRTIFNSPKPVCGLSKDGPLIKYRFHFLERESMAISGLTTPKTIFHGFLEKVYPSRRKPLPLGFAKTLQYWYPRVALALGINFASCLVGIRWTDHRKI